MIPGNWCWTTLKHIARWGSGGTPSRKRIEYYNGSIPWIKTGELNDDFIYTTEEHISEEAVSNSSAKVFPANTVVIAMYGATIGKVGIMGMDSATNQACACAVTLPMIDYKYLFYYARSQKESFIRKGKGGAQPNISQEIIKAHKIPLPPLPEQHRIVARIESLFGKLDEAKEKLHAVIDGYEPREAAILHQAFTGELSKSWREECGERLGGWENRLLGEYLEPLETKKPAGDFFRYIDIDSVDNQCQAVREPKLLAVRDAPSRASRGLREHDVLFSMVRPYLKNIACVDAGLADCIASTGFYVCRCREGLLPAYLGSTP